MKSIIQCNSCKVVSLYPAWTEKKLEKLYLNYRHHKQDFKGQKRKKSVSPYLREYIKKSDDVLEIGHGQGDNVNYLRALGYNVIGIDKDPLFCDEKTLLHKDYKDLSSSVDFIYAIQVFEHIPEPKKFIKKILSCLNPGGRFLLEIPNLDDPLRILFKNKSFEKFYFYPYHVFFYNKNTASKLMENSGTKFKVKLVQRYGIINHIRWNLFRKPGNFNAHIPIVDNIYKWILTEVFKVSDTLLIIGEK